MSVKVNATIPEDLRTAIREMAEATGGTVQAVVLLALTLGMGEMISSDLSDLTSLLAADGRAGRKRVPKSTDKFAKDHPLYLTWVKMKKRCYYARDGNFSRYGGRGITVCERWRKSFWDFVSDVGERPPGKTLDRKNNDGNYEPGNVRWATQSEQMQNTRRAKRYRSTTVLSKAS